jgi:ATP-dependent Clp protease ATP-binding subunit ClpB
MRQDRLTTLAQEVVSEAQGDAARRGNPEVSGLHILAALLKDRSGPGWSVISKTGGDAARIASITTSELDRQPKVSGGAGTPGRALMDLLNRADGEARRLGDAYISSEHLSWP